jgi:hypothetical protein
VTTRQPPRAPAPPRSLMPAALARGSCATHAHPDWWTSSGPETRAAAARICLSRCGVLAECLRWAVTSLPSTDGAIWAGTGPREPATMRRRLRTAQALLDAVFAPRDAA